MNRNSQYRICAFFYSNNKALAALINIYVAALNTPGVVPSVQSAWETFVHTKCSEAKLAALQLYESTMTSQLDGFLPCDSDDIRQVQQTAIGEGMRLFQEETVGVSVKTMLALVLALARFTQTVYKETRAHQRRSWT